MVFADLSVGDLFRQGCRKAGCYGSAILKKIPLCSTRGGYANAQCIEDGLLHYVDASRMVERVALVLTE